MVPESKTMLATVFAGLMLISVVFLAGCDDDNDQRTNLNARISDANSVFALFADKGDEGFIFAEGLFGPNGNSTSPTTLTITNVTVNGTDSTADFMTDPERADEPDGEGDADAGDSCNYLYDGATDKILCPLCDWLVVGDNLRCGGTSTATIFLHLAAADNPTTRANPPFQSNGLEVSVFLNDDCNLVSINNISVVSAPNVDFIFN